MADSSRQNVTSLLANDGTDPELADQLLPLVYAELRRLAANLMQHEQLGQTLQPTALVHEAYVCTTGCRSQQSVAQSLAQSWAFLCRGRSVDAADSDQSGAQEAWWRARAT